MQLERRSLQKDYRFLFNLSVKSEATNLRGVLWCSVYSSLVANVCRLTSSVVAFILRLICSRESGISSAMTAWKCSLRSTSPGERVDVTVTIRKGKPDMAKGTLEGCEEDDITLNTKRTPKKKGERRVCHDTVWTVQLIGKGSQAHVCLSGENEQHYGNLHHSCRCKVCPIFAK